VGRLPDHDDVHMTKQTAPAHQREAVDAAAARLESATRTGTPCAPITDLIGHHDIALAYQVQLKLTTRRCAAGARVIGRKIGLTSAAVQSQVGVDRPDFGVLFDDMKFLDGQHIPYERLLQPKAEGEIAFVLGRDITSVDTRDAVRSAVTVALPAIEIVDSRIAQWRIGITDTVADNASSGVFVIGERGVPLDRFEPVSTAMEMRRGGVTISAGTGSDCLGDPLSALAWLAETAIEFGDPLRAGDIVLSGALGPMVDVRPSDNVVVDIEPLGAVTAIFTEGIK